MKFYLVLIVSFCCGVKGFSQLAATTGTPFIEFFNEFPTSAELQCWAITQDTRGVFYFGGNKGILEYDGKSWRLIKVKNNSAVRSLALGDDGVIYVGATREFGMLKPDASGRMSYYSLSQQLPETRFETVWRIHCTPEGIYFVAGRQIIYKYFHNTLVQLLARSPITEMRTFKIGEEIFVSDINEGIGKVINDTITFFHAGYEISKMVIYSILQYSPDYLLIGTRKDGLFVFNINHYKTARLTPKSEHSEKDPPADCLIHTSEKDINIFNSEVNTYLKSSQIYNAKVLSDNTFVFSTLLGGIVIIDRNGKLINIFNRKNGINDNSVYSIFEDASHNLWLGMENGIARIEFGSPFTLFDKRNGIDGTILCSYFYKNILYIGTSSGIYALNNGSGNINDTINSFRLLTSRLFNLDFLSVSSYDKSRNVLLAASLREIIHISGNKITELKKVYGCVSMVPSVRIPGRVFLGHSNGISALKVNFQSGDKVSFTDEGDLINVKENIKNLVIDSKGDVWFSTAYNGIGYIRFSDDENLSEYEVFKLDTSKGFPDMSNNYLAFHNGKLLLATSKGLYRAMIPETDINNPYTYRFVPDLNYGLNYSADSVSLSLLSIDNKQNVWMYTSKGLVKFDLLSDQLVTTPFKRIKDEGIDKIYIDNQGNGWFVNKTKLFRYDVRRDYNIIKDFPVIIRKVTIGKDSVIYYGAAALNDTLKLPANMQIINFRFNSVIFEYAALNFIKENHTVYSYFLEGFDHYWSKWSEETKTVFTNLPSGKYNFMVKARNIYDVETQPVIYSFIVSTPWYLSIYAYFIYGVILLFIVYLIIYIYTLRLKAEKDHLEELIKAAINKVEQQKEELKVQAEKLAQTNVELEKLSIVARETDNAVVIMDARGNYEWINEGFTRIYGYSLEQLIEDKNRNIIGVTSNLNIKDLVNVWFGDKKPIIYEAMSTTRDGRTIWAQTTLTPIIDENGQLVRLIAIDTDITKIKNAEAEIQMQRDEIQRQRDFALKQRDEIMMQKKEITDSIHYAKRIQKAILPNEDILYQHLPESFLLNLPRDIVSGDFFWISEKSSCIYVAVADCTGHGVPGALMSMIGITFLNEIVVEKGITDAGKILDHLRAHIIHSLRQSADDIENQDGMDISLCVIDKDKKTIEFAGANQSIIFIQNSEAYEVKPDKMPISIGIFEDKTFSKVSLNMFQGDMVYMFSDGYIDQFGGPSEKKYKFSSFKDLLKSISHLPVSDQKIALENEFEKWKGDLHQVDDILILGFRIT